MKVGGPARETDGGEVEVVRERLGRQDRTAARTIRRDRLLKAAADVLQAGHQPFSTNAVAARSGVATGSLYKLFRDKDALLLALLEEEGRQFAEAVEPFAENGAWVEAAERLTGALIRYHRSRPRLAAALLAEEQRLRQATPRGVLTITDDAVFYILSEEKTPFYRNQTLAARYLSAMLCSMAVISGDADGVGDADAQAGLLASLQGYLAWFYGPKR